MASSSWRARARPAAIALLLFTAAGVLEALHGYLGYQLSGRPEFGYTLRGQPLTLGQLIARTLPSWIVLGLLAGVALRLAERRPLFSTRWPRALLFHLPLATLFAASFLALAGTFRHFLFVGPEAGITFSTMLLRYYTVYFNTFFLWYWGIVGVYSGFLHYRDVRERDVQTERLQRKLTEARLRTLQQQLEPHFLFNTLNAASGLALEGDVDGTVRTLSRLGDLLRATLRRHEQVVSVAEEMELLDLYLDVQRVRFEERLQVRKCIDASVLDAEIPTFLLQPLVENAVRHGITHESEAGWIEIVVRPSGTRLRVTVTDSGRGLGPAPRPDGFGLRNCRARLEQLYGAEHTLEIGNADGAGARVVVEWSLRTMPARTEPSGDVVPAHPSVVPA